MGGRIKKRGRPRNPPTVKIKKSIFIHIIVAMILLLFSLIGVCCFSFKQSRNTISNFAVPIKDEYRITSTQGNRDIIIKDGKILTSGAYHNAIDFSVVEGTEIYAAKDGEVITNYPSFYNEGKKWYGHPLYGGLIEINHKDGTMTRYAHLSKTLVSEGTKVKKGQLIGLSGGVCGKRGSGISTGPHLHFEIILNIDKFLDK